MREGGERMSDFNREMMGIETIPMPPAEEQRLRDAGRKIVGALSIRQRPPGPAKAHEFLVGQLVGQGALVNGFKKALVDTFGDGEPCGEEPGCGCENDDGLGFIDIKPDAFTITEDEVCIYEVEVTSHLTERKLKQYAILWDVLDYYHSAFCRLFRIGSDGSMHEVDLPAACFAASPGADDDDDGDDDEDEDGR